MLTAFVDQLQIQQRSVARLTAPLKRAPEEIGVINASFGGRNVVSHFVVSSSNQVDYQKTLTFVTNRTSIIVALMAIKTLGTTSIEDLTKHPHKSLETTYIID